MSSIECMLLVAFGLTFALARPATAQTHVFVGNRAGTDNRWEQTPALGSGKFDKKGWPKPRWWKKSRAQFGKKALKKCKFLGNSWPQTGDSCQEKGHDYFCLLGDAFCCDAGCHPAYRCDCMNSVFTCSYNNIPNPCVDSLPPSTDSFVPGNAHDTQSPVPAPSSGVVTSSPAPVRVPTDPPNIPVPFLDVTRAPTPLLSPPVVTGAADVVTAAPIPKAPITASPTTNALETLATTTKAPVTSSPTTTAPVTPVPTTTFPVTFLPISPAPTSASPVTISPTTAFPLTPAPSNTSNSPASPLASLPPSTRLCPAEKPEDGAVCHVSQRRTCSYVVDPRPSCKTVTDICNCENGVYSCVVNYVGQDSCLPANIPTEMEYTCPPSELSEGGACSLQDHQVCGYGRSCCPGPNYGDGFTTICYSDNLCACKNGLFQCTAIRFDSLYTIGCHIPSNMFITSFPSTTPLFKL